MGREREETDRFRTNETIKNTRTHLFYLFFEEEEEEEDDFFRERERERGAVCVCVRCVLFYA